MEPKGKWREFMGGILRRESDRIESEPQLLESSAYPTGWNQAFAYFLLSVKTALTAIFYGVKFWPFFENYVIMWYNSIIQRED